MKIIFRLISIAACIMVGTLTTYAADKVVNISSPDGRITATIKAGKTLTYSVALDGKALLNDSKIELYLADGSFYGTGKPSKVTYRSVDETFDAIAYKRAKVRDNYNEVTLNYKKCKVIFRAYDDCIAYRFISKSGKEFKVAGETAEFNFAGNWNAWNGYARGGFASSFESQYNYGPISRMDPTQVSFLPLMIDAADGVKINIMESALYKYPGMYILGDGSSKLHGVWPSMPKEIVQGGHNNIMGLVTSREGYIATCKAGEKFPWRIVAISTSDVQMADNDIVYRLGDAPAKDMDFSWVKPGKVAWDWWNDWYITGVDFKAGVNNDTYKAYIDFASKNGIEYVILDDGWSDLESTDLLKVVPEIDLKELVAYATERNVGLILWAGYLAFDRDMEKVCQHYSQMGIKGFKVDFMNRDDQPMVEFFERAARTGAKYHLVLDFHGAFKPHGLNRTWPNVLNYEGVYGLENMKWCSPDTDQPRYDVTFPYIRMAAGVVDYTQGAMRNAARGHYHPDNEEPMSMGTRCHQLGEYVIFDSPLCMLCDSPVLYSAEKECLSFISRIPTVFDESLGLQGKVGEYIIMARRSGNSWYVGGGTNWDAREVTLDLGFLGGGVWKAEIFRDGANADKHGTDYIHETKSLDASDKLTIKMASGGGFAIVLTK